MVVAELLRWRSPLVLVLVAVLLAQHAELDAPATPLGNAMLFFGIVVDGAFVSLRYSMTLWSALQGRLL